MSGIAPFFLTGANAKIKLNGRTLAFCTDLRYSVQILTQTPKTLGSYEGASVEPLSYTVSGSFSIIRYIKDAKTVMGPNSSPPDTNNAGNGVGNWGTAWNGPGGFLSKNGFGDDGRAHEALDPSKFSNGTTFDIEVYQKTSDRNTILGVARIRSCRITQADFQISKRSPATQTFNFVALYADEDSFNADFSSQGQQL